MVTTIYTSNTCAYCEAAKDYFKSNNIDYTEINVDDVPEKRQEAFELSGQMKVPVILMVKDDGSKEISVGFNEPQLSAAFGL